MKDRRYYAVHVGDDCSENEGSTIKREALRMARRAVREKPNEKVRVVMRTVEDDHCDGIIYVRRDEGGNWCYEYEQSLRRKRPI